MIDLRAVEERELRAGAKGAKVALLDGDLARRSLLALLRSSKALEDLPTPTGIKHAGKQYVALIGRYDVAAIYRVRNDLQLKRMRRIPQPVVYTAELERRAAHV